MRKDGDDSLDHWIDRLNGGDVEAVERVFLAYEPYLRIAVRRRLGRGLQAKLDSRDIVQSVFANVLGGVRDGAWHFEGRDQLRAFLRTIAWRRIADRFQEHAPALGREQPLDATRPNDLPRSKLPRASEVAQGREFWERILRACPPAHREVVRLRMEGLLLAEIAARTGLHEGSVRRVLYDLARKLAISRGAGAGPSAEAG